MTGPATRTLRTKILMTLIPAMLVSIVTIAATIFYSFNSLHSDYKSLLEDKVFAITEGIRRVMLQNMMVFPFDAMNWMDTYLNGVVNNNPDISYAFIANTDLLILYHSDEGRIEHQLKRAEYRQIDQDSMFQRLMFPVGSHYEVIVPILQNDQLLGTIHVGVSKELIDSRILTLMGISITVLVLTWGAALLLMYMVLKRHILHPITLLADKAAYVSQHRDLTQHIDASGDDEIGVLSRSFNTMIISLRQYYDDLESKVHERTLELQQRNTQLNSEIVQRQRLESSLREAKEDAEAASRAKSEFVARMSHEIRTPMNAVIGLTQLALRTELTGKQRDYLNKIRDSSHILLGIINDILDFSKIEAGKMSLEAIPFNLHEVMNNLANMVSLKSEDKGLEILMDQDPQVPPHLCGDPLRLAQVLINLVSNAIKFTRSGEVVIATRLLRRQQDRAEIGFSVTDTGIGMSEQQMQGLFSSFYQADGSITRKYGGTGLGLAISRQLVEMMGGRLEVHSALGQGSRFAFSVTLPVLQQVAPRSQLPADLRGRKVLVVDDNATTRQVLRTMLEAVAFDVTTVADGHAALALLERDAANGFSLVLMDWQMPGIDGIETTRRIRAHPRVSQTPAILMVTAYGREEVMQAAAHVGIDGVLVKPVEQSLLYNTIIDMLCSLDDRDAGAASSGRAAHHRLDSIAGAHVLLVEDNAINQMVASELLTQAGVVVDLAHNGRQGLDMASSGDYALVLMDVQMPEMDGLEATRRLRARGITVPVVAMTAHAMASDREESLAAGMNDHLTKPIDPQALETVLVRWIRHTPDATLPAPAAASTTPDDEAPLLDTALGLRQVGGAAALYHTLLQRFVQDQHNWPERLLQVWHDGRHSDAHRMAHSLKGSAATLGALSLASVAARLEQACLQRDTPAVDQTVALLLPQRSATLAAIQTVLDGSPATSPAAPTLPATGESVLELYRQLSGLLRSGDARAEDVLAEWRRAPLPAHNPDDMHALVQAVEDLETATAIDLLARLGQQMQLPAGTDA